MDTDDLSGRAWEKAKFFHSPARLRARFFIGRTRSGLPNVYQSYKLIFSPQSLIAQTCDEVSGAEGFACHEHRRVRTLVSGIGITGRRSSSTSGCLHFPLSIFNFPFPFSITSV